MKDMKIMKKGSLKSGFWGWRHVPPQKTFMTFMRFMVNKPG